MQENGGCFKRDMHVLIILHYGGYFCQDCAVLIAYDGAFSLHSICTHKEHCLFPHFFLLENRSGDSLSRRRNWGLEMGPLAWDSVYLLGHCSAPLCHLLWSQGVSV